MQSESIDQNKLYFAHQELIGIWQHSMNKDQLPAREAFDPGRLRMYLGCMSMVEIESDGGVRYRFAGSRLRSLFGGDSRGRRLATLQEGGSKRLGNGMAEAIRKQVPVQGHTAYGGEMHIWLRLPVSCKQSGLLILCHDQFLPISLFKNKSSAPLFAVSNTDSSMAA